MLEQGIWKLSSQALFLNRNFKNWVYTIVLFIPSTGEALSPRPHFHCPCNVPLELTASPTVASSATGLTLLWTKPPIFHIALLLSPCVNLAKRSEEKPHHTWTLCCLEIPHSFRTWWHVTLLCSSLSQEWPLVQSWLRVFAPLWSPTPGDHSCSRFYSHAGLKCSHHGHQALLTAFYLQLQSCLCSSCKQSQRPKSHMIMFISATTSLLGAKFLYLILTHCCDQNTPK